MELIKAMVCKSRAIQLEVQLGHFLKPGNADKSPAYSLNTDSSQQKKTPNLPVSYVY